ncbi:unnamed protein product [Arctogadus glacialis]
MGEYVIPCGPSSPGQTRPFGLKLALQNDSPFAYDTSPQATCVLHNFLRAKKLQRWRRCRVEPDIDPSSAPEVLRDAPRMGSNNATRQALQIREAYCAHFNAEGAVAWQPRV